jgi:hypothetical protein
MSASFLDELSLKSLDELYEHDPGMRSPELNVSLLAGVNAEEQKGFTGTSSISQVAM